MKYFVLKEIMKQAVYDTKFKYVDSDKFADARKCPKCGNYISAMVPLPPYLIGLELWDRGYGDMAFSTTDEILVTERF